MAEAKILAKERSAALSEMHPEKYAEWRATPTGARSKRAHPTMTWWKEQGYGKTGRPAKGSPEALERMAKVREAKLKKNPIKVALGLGEESVKDYNEMKKNAKGVAKGHPHYIDHMPAVGGVSPVTSYDLFYKNKKGKKMN